MLPKKEVLHPKEQRLGYEILTLRNPAHEDLLRGLSSDFVDLAIARKACKKLWSWRNQFNIAQRGRGMFALSRHIDKADADRLLRLALAELQEGGGR